MLSICEKPPDDGLRETNIGKQCFCKVNGGMLGLMVCEVSSAQLSSRRC